MLTSNAHNFYRENGQDVPEDPETKYSGSVPATLSEEI